MVSKLRTGISQSIEIIRTSRLSGACIHRRQRQPIDLDAVIRARIAHHPDATIIYEERPT